MKRTMVYILTLILLFFTTQQSGCNQAAQPLTVIIVIDQFAYSYLFKLSRYLKNGIKFFMQEGIFYKNAYYPHALPSTGPGHTGLATGITADYHGIVGNNWCDKEGNKIACDDGDFPKFAVINPINGDAYSVGKGPANIMVDGISDQFVLSSQPTNPHMVFSLSLKSRSAICTANKLGKAVWFDAKTGYFTSSHAYFDSLPSWLNTFNKQKKINTLSKISWPLYFSSHAAPYHFKNIDNYTYSSRPPMAGKTFSINWNSEKPLELFQRTPAANQLLFDLALHCIHTHINSKSPTKLLLWVCLSPLDMVGHNYGPQSREVIDMIYHLDAQIAQFMNAVSSYLKRSDTLFVLTADHGVSPIPEILNDEGYSQAHRINFDILVPALNQLVHNEFGIPDLIKSCTSSQIFFQENLFNTLNGEQQKGIIALLKEELVKHPGIKRVWTQEELAKSCYEPEQIESFYKRQMYPGRTGRLIIQPFAYCLLDDFNKGTGHRTPYESDTHVPLILYQKGNLEKQIIDQKVWTLQLANSLAYLLHIQKPSASTYDLLPGLIMQQEQIPEPEV